MTGPARKPYKPTAPTGWAELLVPLAVGFVFGAATVAVFMLWGSR